MAKMIPQDLTQLPKNATQGEKILYRIIERNTPDDWICYVGQRLAIGPTPDFILIGPDLGVLILEENSVPINLVHKSATEKWTIDIGDTLHEEIHPLRLARDNVEEVAQAMKGVKRLTDESGHLKFNFAHGVILSSIRRNEIEQSSIAFHNPPMATFEPHRVICSDELPNNRQKKPDFAIYLRLMTRPFRFDPLDDVMLDDGDIQSIRCTLFPEVRARLLANELSDRNAILEALTVEQEQMARGIGKNDKVPHRRLNGIAGSGKTIILRTRVTDIARANPDWKILVTFYTRSLKEYIGANLPYNIDVMTVGQSIYRQWKNNGLDMNEFDVESEEKWSHMIQVLTEKGLSRGIYQAIFLDEAQDLIPYQADYLRYLLSETTNCAFFCGDSLQNIFIKKQLHWINHGFKFKGRTSGFGLSCNYRNTHEIFAFALDFIKDNFTNRNVEHALSEAPSNPYSKIETQRRGPIPIPKKYTSYEEERDNICKEIRRLVNYEKVNPRAICILHPNATEKNAEMIKPYITNINSKNIPTYWLSESQSSKIKYNPKCNYVTISTPESGKGLEWDIVFMPSIDRYYAERPNNLRFVAATRAREILYPSACGDYR